MKRTYIYILIDPRTNMIRYVGKADNCDNRFRKHIYEANTKNNHKANWIKSLLKENLTPILEIIDEVDNCEWEFWECHYISLYKSWGFVLVNQTNGGEGGTMSPEILKIIAIKSRGNKNMKDKNHTKETKKIISKKLKEYFIKNGFSEVIKEKQKISQRHRQKSILQFDLKGNLIKEWNGIKEAAKTLNINYQGIQSSCHNRKKFSYGFIWIFKNEFNETLLREKIEKANAKRKLTSEQKQNMRDGKKNNKERIKQELLTMIF